MPMVLVITVLVMTVHSPGYMSGIVLNPLYVCIPFIFTSTLGHTGYNYLSCIDKKQNPEDKKEEAAC